MNTFDISYDISLMHFYTRNKMTSDSRSVVVVDVYQHYIPTERVLGVQREETASGSPFPSNISASLGLGLSAIRQSSG